MTTCTLSTCWGGGAAADPRCMTGSPRASTRMRPTWRSAWPATPVGSGWPRLRLGDNRFATLLTVLWHHAWHRHDFIPYCFPHGTDALPALPLIENFSKCIHSCHARLSHHACPQTNLSTFTLVGHSLGAFVATCYSLKHTQRVERLVLAAPVCGRNYPLRPY